MKVLKKRQPLNDRVTTTFREIPVNLIDEPDEDLRFFRSAEFEGVLLDDLRREGAIIPLIVRSKTNSDRFVIVDGVTRFRNAVALGDQKVACQILNVDEATAIFVGLKMNILRRSHDAVGLAKAFKLLHDKHKVKYKDIAARFSYTKSWITKIVALNDLSREFQEAVSQGKMTIEDGYSLASGDKAHILEHLDERRQIQCEVCACPRDALAIVSMRVCLDCQRGYEAYRVDRERRYKADMERARKRLAQKQTELVK